MPSHNPFQSVHLYWIPQREISTARWVVWSAGLCLLGVPGPPCGALAASRGEVRVATPQSWRLSGPETRSWYRESVHRDQVLVVSREQLPEFLDQWQVSAPALYGAPPSCQGPTCSACAWLAGITLTDPPQRRSPSSRLQIAAGM